MRPEILSIVVPAYNEQENVGRLYAALRDVTDRLNAEVEIIFVDDGSTDGTAGCVRALRATDSTVRLITLSRNFGHQAALLAGLTEASGDAVITLDCDLQHPPELIGQMVEAWRGGAAIVQMVRKDTHGANWFKRFTSRMFYRLMGFLSDQPVTLGPDFQLLDRRVVQVMLGFRHSRPFVRGFAGWAGFRVERIDFVAPERSGGESRFSLQKMVQMALDGVTAMSTKPLRLATYIGFFTTLLCLVYAVYALAGWMRGITVPGWVSLLVSVLFLGAVQLTTIGILGEYVGRIYEIVRQVPPYVVEQEPAEEQKPRARSAAAGRS